MAEDRRGEGFLSRWSRLKRGEALPEPAAAPVPAPGPEVLPEPVCEAVPEAEIDLSSLPPVEEITAGTDISGFLRKGVPAALRNAALRRAWSADPVIRDFVGPADYAWDWNVPGGVPGYAADIASGPDVDALADRILGLVKRESDQPAAATQAPEADATPTAEAEAPPVALNEPEAEPGPLPGPEALADAPAAIAPPRADEARPAVPVRPRHGGAVPT